MHSQQTRCGGYYHWYGLLNHHGLQSLRMLRAGNGTNSSSSGRDPTAKVHCDKPAGAQAEASYDDDRGRRRGFFGEYLMATRKLEDLYHVCVLYPCTQASGRRYPCGPGMSLQQNLTEKRPNFLYSNRYADADGIAVC